MSSRQKTELLTEADHLSLEEPSLLVDRGCLSEFWSIQDLVRLQSEELSRSLVGELRQCALELD